MNKEFHVLTTGSSLPFYSISIIREFLKSGKFSVIPSDTGYALTGLPFRLDAIKTICKILHHEHDPISLSFGSITLVERYVELTARDYHVLDIHCPGPITLVCELNKKIPTEKREKISNLLHTNGTLGVRISDSPVERQISIELDSPITTCAIRDDGGNIVTHFDDAIDIVKKGLKEIHENCEFIAVRANKILYTEQSTVLSIKKDLNFPYRVEVFRQGVVKSNELKHSLDLFNRIKNRDFDDFT